MSLATRVFLSFAAVVALAGACPAAPITYHVSASIPAEFRGEEDFVHFTLYGEASGTPRDTITIRNFQTDGTHYHFDPGQGTVSGQFPGDVVLTDDDATGNFSVYNQRVTFGTTMSFDVVLAGPQFEGDVPVTGFIDFVLDINRPASASYAPILQNSTGFGAVEIYRDASIDGGALTVDANDAFTVTLVPEPAGLAAAAVAGGLALLRRRRRTGCNP